MSDLSAAIAALRVALWNETPARLHSRAIPVLRDSDGTTDRRNADEGGMGPPFSAAFHRYLAHPDSWGLARLGMSSILEVSEACAARHPTHRRPLFTRSLCGQLLYEVGYLGQSIDDVMWITGLSREQVEGLLSWGLVHAAHWRFERFLRLTREPGADKPPPERKRTAA